MTMRITWPRKTTRNEWRLGLVCAMALVLALAAAAVIYFLLWQSTPHARHSQQRPEGVLDVLKVTLTILAFVGAVLTAVYAFRRQALAERAHLSERYEAAVQHLGQERAEARLAGVYAMERLADEWVEQRQMCIEVLCAYLRLPYQHEEGEPDFDGAEREVRRSIIKLIRNHLRDAPPGESWQGYNFSFEGAVFDCGDLSRIVLRGTCDAASRRRGHMSFYNARFVKGRFLLEDMRLEGGHLWFGASLEGGTVSFKGARFISGYAEFKHMTGATSADPNFEGAQHLRAVINWGTNSAPRDWPPKEADANKACANGHISPTSARP